MTEHLKVSRRMLLKTVLGVAGTIGLNLLPESRNSTVWAAPAKLKRRPDSSNTDQFDLYGLKVVRDRSYGLAQIPGLENPRIVAGKFETTEGSQKLVYQDRGDIGIKNAQLFAISPTNPTHMLAAGPFFVTSSEPAQIAMSTDGGQSITRIISPDSPSSTPLHAVFTSDGKYGLVQNSGSKILSIQFPNLATTVLDVPNPGTLLDTNPELQPDGSYIGYGVDGFNRGYVELILKPQGPVTTELRTVSLKKGDPSLKIDELVLEFNRGGTRLWLATVVNNRGRSNTAIIEVRPDKKGFREFPLNPDLFPPNGDSLEGGHIDKPSKIGLIYGGFNSDQLGYFPGQNPSKSKPAPLTGWGSFNIISGLDILYGNVVAAELIRTAVFYKSMGKIGDSSPWQKAQLVIS